MNDKIKQNKEFWDIEKSAKRLIWRLAPNEKGETQSFKPNENDFNALKSILGSLDREKNKSMSYAPLFAKLFIYVLNQNIRHLETTFLDTIPEKELSRLLNTNVELFFKAFYNDLKDNQLNKLTKTDDKNKQNEILKEYQDLQKTYTYDYVKGQLIDMINKALKRFK